MRTAITTARVTLRACSIVAQSGCRIDARRAARGEIGRGRRSCDHQQHSATIGQFVEHVDAHQVRRELTQEGWPAWSAWAKEFELLNEKAGR